MGNGQSCGMLRVLESTDQIKKPRRREAGEAQGVRNLFVPIIPYINKTIKGRFL